MEIGVSTSILTQKKTSDYLSENLNPYSTRWVKTIVVFLHIYEARAIFLLFSNHRNNESESPEMEIGVAGPIFNQETIKKDLWDNNIHTPQYEGKQLCWLLIFIEL